MWVVTHLHKVMAFCESVQDYQTREILQAMLKDTEDDHTYWLEQQLGMTKQVGLPNYLQSQI
jgi:bacterioferritin